MSMPAVHMDITTPGERIARSLIEDMSALVSPPDVCLKINELVADDSTSLEQLALVVIRDPNLTARILKLANSAFYGLPGRVDTITRAVMLLGMGEIQKIVTSVCAVQTFSRLSSSVTNMNSFWRHGVYTGLVAQAIARRARVLHPERLFVAGMLHDIGTLLINKRFPEIAQSVIIEAAGDEDKLHVLEQRDLGFDHAMLTGMMLDSWNLPDTLVDTVYWHHEPQRARRAGAEAAILKVADAVANCSGTGSYSERIPREQQADVSPLANHGLAIDCSGEELMDEVDPQFIEAIYLIVA
ncbi:MAG: HDOD domain-containing protein [Proteobacteria bacterium]|nr:HDOD domain-containing protein [Pseudomonadota bacterium]